jgi:hypothetical protein
MAIRYVCDRCGHEESDSSEIFTLKYPSVSQYGDMDNVLKCIDICRACVRKLNDFLMKTTRESK